MKERIAICVPVYNEAQVLDLVIEEIWKVVREAPNIYIIIINDHSTDSTGVILEAIDYTGLNIINHSTRKGVGGCIYSGIKKAKELGVDNVCLWPGNYRIKSDSVLKIIDYYKKNKGIYLHGTRFQYHTNTPIGRKVVIFLLSKFASKISNQKITDISCGMRVFPLSMIDDETLDSLIESKYMGEQMLTIRALQTDVTIREFGVSLSYEKERNYSHVKAHHVFQVFFPWVRFLVANITNKITSIHA